ncbi:MAG TPA: ribokinase [Opitutaceae bacterium]|nr:ribokinase [Opitutaceae bacterium]
MAKNGIVVVGSSNTDMIVQMARLPKLGETILGGVFSVAAGGKGANQAVGAARAGARVSFVARVGRDMFGAQAVASLAKDGINVRYISKDRVAPSGVALIFVGKNGENSIAVAPGANGRLSPSDIKKARKAFAAASTLVVQLETPLATVLAAARLATEAGLRVILNPAPARALPDKLFKHVSILTPNETETELLTGIKVDNTTGAAEAAGRLMAKGVQTVIITLGRRGAFVATGPGMRLVPGFKVRPVDTTAAGDVFNGALAAALDENQPLLEAVRFANAAAAISVTRLGAQPSAPNRKEIDSFLATRLH